MKIVFIPSFVVKPDGKPIPFIPLGVLSIMGCLRIESNNEITILDLNCLLHEGQNFSTDFYDYVTKLILDAEYDLIGFSTNSSSFHHVVSIAKRIKRQNPKITIIVGGQGPNTPSIAHFILITFPYIDYLVFGEGETTVPKLIQSIQKGEVPVDLPGIYFRYNGKTILNEPNSFIENLDKLPIPDFESPKIANNIYKYKNSESKIHIEQGRGCPFKCTYCSTCFFWRYYPRTKSVFRVIKEMDVLNELYSLNNFYLINDCFNSDQGYLLEFCKQMQLSKKAYNWECSLRVDRITKKILDELWGAGCRSFSAGIESGSKRIQRLINKNLNLNHVLNILSYAAKKGFNIRTNFIIGFPEETKSDLIMTMKLHKNCLDIGVNQSNVNLLTPLPGSKLIESGNYQLLFDGFGSTDNPYVGLLEENVRDIQKYPLIFSPFYFFKPFYVSRKEFIEATIFGNGLNNLTV